MQATNKSDATQVYEGAVKSSRTGTKGALKYILKPLTIFGYHYFIEGIRAVQKDGPTKELEKITNLSYEETIKVMEKCQQDGVRVVATERALSKENSEFGKKKSLYQQKKITKYARRIKQMSNFKAGHPKVAKLLHIDSMIKNNESKQKEEQIKHKNKHYNVYFNKSKRDYMSARIADVIELRTGISQKLFDETTQKAIENLDKERKVQLNSQQLEQFSQEFKLHELGNVEPEKFKKDYCIHELPFGAYMSIKDDLEVADIQYGAKVTKDSNDKEIVNIYMDNNDLERYCELGFNNYGKIRVYGSENKNLQWSINSQDELVTFTTKIGKDERETYSRLSGKNYVMKRQDNECLWTVLKTDLEELVETEKKRDVVGEELEKYHIIENNIELTDNTKEIEVDLDIEKEVGDE
ncbi:MAG: hypothetical protein ACI4U4_01410 [Bacilli bacterium]